MDFSNITKKAKELSEKWIARWVAAWKMSLKAWKKAKDNAVEYTENSLRNSRFIIKDAESFIKSIDLSEQKTFTDKTTWVVKKFNGTFLLFVCEEDSDFTKSLLFRLPVLFAKSFSQNTHFGIVLWDIDGIKISKYSKEKPPLIVFFENTKVKKVIVWEENIQKVVNSLSLDINKMIHEL